MKYHCEHDPEGIYTGQTLEDTCLIDDFAEASAAPECASVVDFVRNASKAAAIAFIADAWELSLHPSE